MSRGGAFFLAWLSLTIGQLASTAYVDERMFGDALVASFHYASALVMAAFFMED